LGYTLQAPYFTENLRFVHGNVIITLSQTLVPAAFPPPSSRGAEGEEDMSLGDEVFGKPWPREGLKLVDQSGGWVVQAAVRVANNTDVDNINVGVNELGALKEVLKGVCELDVVERLALDTRVR